MSLAPEVLFEEIRVPLTMLQSRFDQGIPLSCGMSSQMNNNSHQTGNTNDDWWPEQDNEKIDGQDDTNTGGASSPHSVHQITDKCDCDYRRTRSDYRHCNARVVNS